MGCIKSKAEKRLTKEQRVEAIQEMLNDHYPTQMVIAFGIIKTLLVVCILAMQTLAFTFKTKYYFIGAGYWVAPFVVIPDVLLFILVNNRSPKLHQGIELLRFFTNIIEAVYVGVQFEGLKATKKDSDTYQFIWVIIVLFICGVIIQIFGAIYTIMMIVKTQRAYRRMGKVLDEESNKKLMQA